MFNRIIVREIDFCSVKDVGFLGRRECLWLDIYIEFGIIDL